MPNAPREPGLHLHTSNRLETLAAALAEVTRAPLSSPFRTEIIVVQSQGMARWLKQRLAERHGICANIAFPFPNEVASDLFLALFPELPSQPPFARDVMLWLVMKHLPALLERPAFEDPRRYLADPADLRKRHQLARKIAYLFDQYFIFRPDLIRAWDRGEDSQWQAELWRRIRPEISHRHPAELQADFAQLVHRSDIDISHLPERISVFGIAALPPFHLELITALGRHIPVHLFIGQPSRFYWGEITSGREEQRLLKRYGREPANTAELHLERGNRLLASLGPLGRDFLKLIYSGGDWQEHDDFTEPGGDSLLALVQSDILNLRDRGRKETGTVDDRTSAALQMVFPLPGERAAAPAKEAPSHADDSIQIHSCHSPLREMEVLNDHLLKWFNDDPHLTPRDVVVMMPDIEAYAPFIEAVFGSPEVSSHRIPFRIADRSARQSSELVLGFLDLLEMPQTRLGATTVLALLENRAVRAKFALAETDLELARRWIVETRIRWGAGPEHRARLDLPPLPGNTWREGLDRLLLGYAMAGRGQAMFGRILPYDDMEGESALVLGRLAGFIERLFNTVDDLGQPRRLHDWAARLQRVLDDFFQTDEENEPDLQIIRAALHALAHQHSLSHFDEPLQLGVILEQLTPELEQDRQAAGFLTGGVTFCALKPMRSIPFQVICLVGMNDSVFPRPNAHLSFDLMSSSPRLGDRSTRNDDRYLFLETILSARRRLYLSCVGQSIRDNSAIPPSVVVSELLDYLAQGFDLQREQVVIQHRLQAFHEAYFQPGGRLFSFSAENCQASQAARRADVIRAPFLSTPLSEPEAEFRQLAFDQLAAFLCHPAAFLLQRRLHVRLRKGDGALEDREPFALDAREGYSIKQRLLEDRLAGIHPSQTLAQIAAAGVLPLGQVGQAQSQSLSASVDAFWQRLQAFEPQRTGTALEIDLAIQGFRLTGRLMIRPAGGVLSYRIASIKAPDVLRVWIQHLVANAANPAAESILVGTDATHRFRSCPDASAVLGNLLQLYWQGLREPLKFFPRASLAFAEAELKLAAHSKKANPLGDAFTEWKGNGFRSIPGERDDLTFNLCFGHQEPLDEHFKDLARRVFNPMLQHRTVEEA